MKNTPYKGILQGGLNAPQKSLWGRWAPTNERTTMVALFRVGTNFGTLVTNVIAREYLTLFEFY